MVKHKKLQL
uniref:Uncharacterized protein n=1 Tax=Arundo donax TaxID=35708 RepID=A0A0A9BRL6_ARUDO